MIIREIVSVLLLGASGIFFLAGTVGVLRFPDARTRLHAVAKADTVGLGLVIAGLLALTGSVPAAMKLVLIWLLALVSSAAASYLIGSQAGEVEDERS